MNNVVLIGRLARDPETAKTQNGISRTNLTLAVSRRHKDAEGNYEVDFIKCVAWRQTAEFLAQYGTKGRKVAVNGEIQTRTYDKDGEKRTITEVMVNNAEFVDKAQAEPKQETQTFTEVDDPELPF